MHLFLSPHLDDAVLSCGATIHRLVANGQPVTILTLTAGDPPGALPDTPLVADLHARWNAGKLPAGKLPAGELPSAARRAEDLAACAVLGAAPLHITALDCIYRTDGFHNALYAVEDDLFGDVHVDDPLPQWLMEQKLPAPEDDTTLYVPLGVGHHVDHQIARDWGLALRERHPALAVRFYEEYPYCEDDTATERALDLFFWQEMPLEMQVFWVAESEVNAKCDAIAQYTSQISTFWRSADAMRARVRAAMLHAGRGVFAERYWFTQG